VSTVVLLIAMGLLAESFGVNLGAGRQAGSPPALAPP